MSAIPKVEVAKEVQGHDLHDLSFNNNTTAGFGAVQPLMVLPMLADSVAHVSIDSFVRLRALPAPTFGRMSWNVYHRFVKMADIFPNFDALLGQTTIRTSIGSFVPSAVPTVRLRDITLWLLQMQGNYCSVWKQTNTHTIFSPVVDRAQIGSLRSLLFSNYQSMPTTGATPDQWNGVQFIMTQEAFNNGSFILPDGADFILKVTDGSNVYYYMFRLGTKALNMRKVIIGCGCQLRVDLDKEISVLPFFAFYKAYFDLFAIQQTTSWQDTLAYEILDTIREQNLQMLSSNVNAPFTTKVKQFFQSLGDLYFTDNPDFVSAHISHSSLSTSVPMPETNSPVGRNMETKVVRSSVDSQPYIPQDVSLNRNALLALNEASKMINKRSVTGARLDKILDVDFNAEEQNHLLSKHLGTDFTECVVDDVFNTAETSEANLGEYAGKGIGSSNGSQLEHFTDTAGYWITLGCVVPHAQYTQGIDPMFSRIGYYDFGQRRWDALGFEITQKETILGAQDVALSNATHSPSSFGFIPRYSGYKTKSNILNGCLSLRSLRNTYAPFTLDRLFNTTDIKAEKRVGDNNDYIIAESEYTLPIAGEWSRYIGKDLSNGNFNRIFYNSYDTKPETGRGTDVAPTLLEPHEDNFIIHNRFKVSMISPLMSLKKSFDTGVGDGHTISVEKA